MAAGAELAEALVAAVRARLVAAEVDSQRHAASSQEARRAADAALAALRESEERATSLAHALSERADAEQHLREKLDAARTGVQEVQLAQTRNASEAQALEREQARGREERRAAEARTEAAREAIAAVLPQARGLGAGRALGEAVLGWTRENGFASAVTDWRATNLLSSRTWPRLGFRPSFLRLHRRLGY